MEFEREMMTKKKFGTGGAGFIGGNFVSFFLSKYPGYHIFNLDVLTYAGNLENLKDVEGNPNYTFVKGDIRDKTFVFILFRKLNIDNVIHFAAESHVDHSIANPAIFVETNVIGTLDLLEAAKHHWLE